MTRPARPLKLLFAKKQSKVNANKCTATLLKVYSEGDHKRIALLIDKWLKD
jgi:hypothetical protein